MGGLNGPGDCSIRTPVGWKSQRPAGSLDWIFPAFALLCQGLRDMSSINLEPIWN